MEYGYSRKPLLRCLACQSSDLIVNEVTADVVCRECGEVQRSRLIVESTESKSYEDDVDGKEERTGGMADTAWERREFKGSNLEDTLQLNKLSSDVRGRKEKTLEEVELKTEEIAYALHLQASMTERFKDILSLTLDNTTAATLMRKPRLLVAAGVVYTACRLAHCGRTIEEVSAACAHRVDSKALRRLQADMCRALGLPSGSVAAEELVARIGSQCKQPSPLMERARRACQLISSYNLAASLAPQLVAAVGVVLLTMVGNRKISLRLVAKATLGCNTAQIRRAYSSLYPYFDLLLPGEIRGDFDLALLPRELVTVPSLTGKSHRKELSAAEPSSSSASSSSSSSSSSSEPPAAQESDGSVIKAIDETKPRTRSNSLVEEDWEVVRPLIATRKKTKGKTKAKKRKVGESADAEADAKAEAEAEVEAETEEAPPAGPGKAPQEGESKRKARRLGRDGTDKEVAASTAPKSASAPRPMSGSAPVSKGSAPECQERGRSPASVASASNETSSAGGPVAVAGSIPSSTNATATASATAYLHAHGAKRGTSKASRQAALDAVSSKHGSPLFLTRSR